MAHCTEAEVQQWLERTKLSISAVDEELETTAWDTVVAPMISQTYDISTWTDETTTPHQVRSIVSMLVAAWEYNRSVSDQYVTAAGITWGSKLEALAMQLLGGIASASLFIVGAEILRDPTSRIHFWPTDASTNAADPTLGGNPSDPNASPRVFSIGQVY